MTPQPKHTPGPWEKNGLDINGDGWFLARVNGKRDPGVGSAEAHANARLIAAAPALLEAAKLGLASLGTLGYGESDHAKTIRAAIAKAEGK